MKTGLGCKKDRRPFPETFYISLLTLDAILKRYAFKDSVLFKSHNPIFEMTPALLASGTSFNLFSDYGVGKKIEPLLKELFKNKRIEPSENIFFQEIVNLANTVSPIIRRADSIEETGWTYKYAIENICKVDALFEERIERLLPLLGQGFIDEESEDTSEKEIVYCECGFCMEFRKYNYPKDKYTDGIILDVVKRYW